MPCCAVKVQCCKKKKVRCCKKLGVAARKKCLKKKLRQAKPLVAMDAASKAKMVELEKKRVAYFNKKLSEGDDFLKIKRKWMKKQAKKCAKKCDDSSSDSDDSSC